MFSEHGAWLKQSQKYMQAAFSEQSPALHNCIRICQAMDDRFDCSHFMTTRLPAYIHTWLLCDRRLGGRKFSSQDRATQLAPMLSPRQLARLAVGFGEGQARLAGE